ncbi:zinc finger protein 462 isoform X2 [Coregonus clupeaformis]|uniref:zinc finger protein 462 isoform X2 n=1 Tax=Coregonus clupeaformis TaxID=59861 RepID=UPI001E1C779F|nr:zinc finger protein 462 isoform X2 [Coregonus clupeaformis]
MEEDSGSLDKSDQMTHGQPTSQQSMSPSQSFQCNHCVLLFKSKYFLLEHMKKVHGVDVDPSQSEGSSTPSESSTPPHRSTLYNSSEEVFSCRHCVFTSSSWTVIIKHERTYHKVPVRGPGKGGTLTQKQYLRGKLLNDKVSLPGKKDHKNVSVLQRKQGNVGRVNSKSTLKTINIHSSSLLLKNLRTQVGSSGNCSKFRVVSGSSARGSSLNSLKLNASNLPRPSRAHHVNLMSDAPFLIYDQDNGKGVSKVTEERFHTESVQKGSHCCSLCNFSATWLEDLHTHQRSKHSYLFYSMGSSLLDRTVTEQRNLKPESYNGISLTEPLAKTTRKRTRDDTPLSPAKKNIKTSPESTVIQSKVSGGTAFTFEVSEDEEDGNAWRTELDASGNEMDEHDQLANGESRDIPKILYRCKHCDYSHKSSRSVSTHYQRMHPYIRYDSQYIMNPDDWTATFRCLECPVDFAALDDLKKHYKDHHPEAPNVFMMRSDQLDLVYKCFACPFTISNGKYLKPHYKNKHPKLKMSNPLMYCNFTTKPSENEPSKSQHLGQTSSLKNAEVVSPERSLTPCKETVNITPTSPKACSASMGVDEELYHCKYCVYSNKSVDVMLVHYQKKHPKAKLTINSIKQASLATSRKPKDETQVPPQKMVLEPFKLPEVKSTNISLSRPDVAQEDAENMFFCQHCNYGNLTVRGVLNHQRSRHRDLKASVEQIHLHTAEVRSQSKTSQGIGIVSPSTPLQNYVAQEDILKPFKLPEVKSSNTFPPISDVSQADVESPYFCQFCDYCNPTVRGIMNHQKLRHRTRKSTAERIIKHTAVICSSPNVRGGLNHQKSSHSHLKVTDDNVIKHTAEVHGQCEKPQFTEFDSSNSSFKSTVENEVADLFFCQFCNYGDPSMRGIFNHQKRRHGQLETTPDDIFRHTAEVRGLTKTSTESKRVNSTNSSRILSLPLVTEEAVLFCQLCNYSNSTMSGVMDHQRKRHPDLKATHKQILEYTAAMILAQTGKSPNSFFLTSDVFQEELEKFFCQYCDYSNSTVREILNHQNKMHGDLETNAAQILRHTVVVQGQTKQSQSKAVHSPNSPPILSHPLLKDEVEDMFFCQFCNYSNTTVIGVLNHQRKRHLDMTLTAKQILEYTATVMGKMGKSQPVREDSLNSSQEEEGKLFYCQHCDYDNPTVRGVLNHQKLRHSDLPATADQVVRYTAIVRSSNKKSITQQPNKSSMKASQSRTQKAAPLRSLKCRKCSYITPHIYILKRHLRNNHQEKAPITTIIRWAYQDGHLQAGYHCEWCVCSHTEAKGLLRHYRQRHPDRNTGLESIILRLHAGPKTSRSKKTKPNPERNVKHENITLRFGEVPKTSPSFQSVEGDTKVYPCRACSFKATSVGGISSHYRVVHPWSVKEDGSVLDVISSRQTQEPVVHEQLDVHETSRSSETYRCPVCSGEFNTRHGMFTHCGKKHPEYDMKVHEQLDVHETSKPSQRCRCPVCSGEFNTLHGMLTHCGKKHPEYDTSTYEKEPEPSTDDGTLIFKCSICPYVNSRPHGVLTHCQMRHPAIKARTERLEQEIVHFSDPDECVKVRSGKRVGLAGFRCNMCPVIHAKFKKLKAHYEMDHKRSAFNMFKPALKQSAAIKKQLLSKYRGSQTSIAILKNRKSIIFKCHLCKYFCTTKKGLARHLRINHSTVAPIEDKEFSYKCALCSYTTLICKYLAAHYRRQHGNAAFNNHFVPAFRPHRIPLNSPDHKASLSQETRSPGEKINCSRCFFQCLNEKGMVSHYVICHPGVSHSMHKSSELNPNNTMHSPPKPRNRHRQQKPVCKLFDPQCEKGSALCPVKCKKCVKLFFNSNLLLSIHYTNFHNEDFKQDFTILSKTSENGTEVYRCGYCNLQIQGSADLGSHLDHHNEEFQKLEDGQKSKQHLSEPPLKTKSVTHERQELPDVLMTEESNSHWIVTKVESVATGMGPLVSPSPVPSTTEPDGGSAGEERKHCGQTFMSLKGLRSQGRSHAATAVLKRLDNVPHQHKQMFDRHIRLRPGTIKPFHCGLCRYRTTILSLLKNHLLKVHGAEYPSKNLPSSVTGSQDKEHTLRANEKAPNLPERQESNHMSDDSEETDLTEKSVYLEPPDVQRQLDHYRQVAQASRHPAQQATATTQDGLFVCEFCIYTSTYIKSMRRHYINRHNGKRLVRCKDCSFFTGFRKKLDIHIETAHASSATEAPKDLRCPLCLYHTKNKNCMIDHIILHREEPVAPIEVRRPKLSRYLQGLVFRCHKCTFTSSSDEKLHLHMLIKHDDIKPYKCRLCYFDFTQLSELEAHLCDKHQVVRNHELVGQVHLEELATRLGRGRNEEEHKEETNRHSEKQGLEEEGENTDKLGNKDQEETNRHSEKRQVLEGENIEKLGNKDQEETNNRHSEKRQVLEGENIEKLGNKEEKDQEETNKRHEETHGLKEGDTIEEKVLEENGENIAKQNYEFQGHENKGNVEEKSMDCEENQGQQDEVNKDGDNEVSENTAQNSEFHESHDFSYEENKEEQYEECHEKFENEDMEMVEEQFMDCHEMPVLENEEGKEETHSNHSEKQEHEEEVKNDSLKPECNTKQEQGPVEDNPMSEEKQDHEMEENDNTTAPKDASTTLSIDASTTLRIIPSTRNENALSCELCGRTLMNSTDLERHVMRHGW